MPQTIYINELSDFESALELFRSSPNDLFKVEINPELTVKVVVRGDSWDGRIDARVAQFVIEFQKVFDRAKIEVQGHGSDKPVLKFELKKGSTDIGAKVCEIAEKLAMDLSNEHKFYLLMTVVFCTFGYMSLSKWLSVSKEKHTKEIDRDMQKSRDELAKETSRIALAAIEKLDVERPVRHLIAKLKEEDRIILPGQTDPLSRDEAKKLYPRKPRRRPLEVHLDDLFQIESISLEYPLRVHLKKGDVEFAADFSHSLGSEERESFLNAIRALLDTRKLVEVNLQLDVRLKDTTVVDAVIVGIAKPQRDDAVDFDEVFY